MKNIFKDYPLLNVKKKSIPIFYPHIPKKGLNALSKVLSGRWLGQGPLVDKFEKVFSKKFCDNQPVVAVGSGTDALHLAYVLAGIKKMMKLSVQFSLALLQIYLFYILGPK